MNASPSKGAEHVVAAEKAGERETNASGQLTAPEAAGRRETKEPCPMKTAKSMGTRETNVPEERSAAVRRDGEPLANAAKRRRQREAVTNKQQVATGEQPSSPVREELEAVPPLVDDPADQQQIAAADVGRGEAAHKNSESMRRFEEILREEAREMLTGYLRDGTEYLSASTVSRLDKGVRESQQRARTRTRLHWQTTWYGCARRRCWTGCGRGPSTRVRTRIQTQQEVRWVRSWSRIWKRP